MKATWREWGIGDIIRYSWNEFDGKGSIIGRLTIKETDHGIVEKTRNTQQKQQEKKTKQHTRKAEKTKEERRKKKEQQNWADRWQTRNWQTSPSKKNHTNRKPQAPREKPQGAKKRTEKNKKKPKKNPKKKPKRKNKNGEAEYVKDYQLKLSEILPNVYSVSAPRPISTAGGKYISSHGPTAKAAKAAKKFGNRNQR